MVIISKPFLSVSYTLWILLLNIIVGSSLFTGCSNNQVQTESETPIYERVPVLKPPDSTPPIDRESGQTVTQPPVSPVITTPPMENGQTVTQPPVSPVITAPPVVIINPPPETSQEVIPPVVPIITTPLPPVNLTLPADLNVANELPITLLYKDIFQPNRAIVLTVHIKNSSSKAIPTLAGKVIIHDVNGNTIGILDLAKYDILKNKDARKRYALKSGETKMWGFHIDSQRDATLYQWLQTKQLHEIQLKFFSK